MRSAKKSDLSLSRCHPKGMTLTEILVVVTILALLASVLAVNYTGILGGAKHKIAVQEVSKLRELIEQYKLITGNYPSADEGLTALTKSLPGQNEPLVTSTKILDPWGHAYVYVYPGQHGKFDLASLGADGVEGGDGENADITSWDNTSTTNNP